MLSEVYTKCRVYCNAECRHAGCRVFTVMLNVVMLSIVSFIVILNFAMLCVVFLL